jgi:hypothetical protein
VTNNQLGLIVGYYLARFNLEALRRLDYPTWTFAYRDIAEKLHVNRNSVNHWRDEFDPLFGHRSGWHQRPMASSRKRVVDRFASYDEPMLRKIIEDVLSGRITDAESIL